MEMGGWDGEPETIGVNWSAIGNADLNTTREFAQLLLMAAEMAENFDEYMEG